MQRCFSYVVVCTILATQMISPAEGDDDDSKKTADYENYKGKADELFEFLQTLENDTVLYTIKRSYEKNIKASTGTKTITCLKATVKYASKSVAELCMILKTARENATNPFVTTFNKTGPETIVGEPGFDRMTVQYVGNDEKCVIVQHTAITPFDDVLRSCDMVRASLDSTGVECNKQFTRLCGSRTIITSSTHGCQDVPTPICNEAPKPTTTPKSTTNATEQV
ncbi:unnamed protein product [Ixodes pacificus]